MLAVSVMDPTIAFLFYLAAFICFVLAALGVTSRVAFGWLGLALFTVPVAWDHLAAT